jgi:hypothetical protein
LVPLVAFLRLEGWDMEERQLSRRELLRTIGIAGAVAWAAPVVTSLPAGASAAGPAKRLCRGKDGNCDIGWVQCSDSCGDEFSYCFEHFNKNGVVARHAVCADDFFCDEATPCTSSLDCGQGQTCATNTSCDCFNGRGFCTPKCGHASARPGDRRGARRLGRRASGR